MSRKRQAKKEKRGELARQLGVDTQAVTDDQLSLQSRARVSRFVAVPKTLSIVERPGGLRALKPDPKTLWLRLQVYLVDGHGPSLVGSALWHYPSLKRASKEGGTEPMPEEGARLAEEVRYERPAHFIVLAALFGDQNAANASALNSVEAISLRQASSPSDAPWHPLAAPELATPDWEQPQATQVRAGDALSAAPPLAAAALSLRGVHKTHKLVHFPLASTGWRWSVAVDLRV